ncbi:ABC transporter permease [Arthrobacter psychrolactophilus]|uniref:ABC transporter permease n=1 Tax=Arthrobacter psychrolactophilus TaxID=92442 RepID=UPI0015E8868B|nr:ABC transporter permease [Arthrobacter psychrolactophilus]
MENSTRLILGSQTWILLAIMLMMAVLLWRAALGRSPREMLIAGLHAPIQLAAVALVIAWLSNRAGWAFAFLALMFAVAVWISGHRVASTGRWRIAVIRIAIAVVPVAALMFVAGVLPFTALAIIAVLGQQIGGSCRS